MKSRRGFSIVELMVAGMISTVLAVGLVGMSANLFRKKQKIVELADSLTDQNAISKILEFDMANSRFVTFQNSRLEFVGYAGRNRFRNANMQSVTVSYEIKSIDERPFLLRRELANTGNQQEKKDIIGIDINGIDFLTFDQDSNQWQSMIWNKDRGKRMNVPSAVRIQLHQSGNDVPFMDEVYCTTPTTQTNR